MGGSTCEITAEGAHKVEKHRKQLADPAARASELRRRMLLWLDSEEEAGRTIASWDGFGESDMAQTAIRRSVTGRCGTPLNTWFTTG